MDASLLFVWALSPLTHLHLMLSRAVKSYIGGSSISELKKGVQGISYSDDSTLVLCGRLHYNSIMEMRKGESFPESSNRASFQKTK